jgi:hypothetical protein
VRLPLGARVLVHFIGGDEDTPAVLGHEWGGAFDAEQIGDTAVPLAKVGDLISCGYFSVGTGPAYALAPVPKGAPGAVQITGSITSGTVAGGKVAG